MLVLNNKIRLNTRHFTSFCKTSAVTSKVLLGLDGTCKAAKVATEVVELLLTEVLYADGVDVLGVLRICDIHLALFDELQ